MKPIVTGVFRMILTAMLIWSAACSTPPEKKEVPPKKTEPTGPGYLGILYQDHPAGMLIARVFPETPADRAGLRPRDVIIALNDSSLAGVTVIDFRTMIMRMRPGTGLELQVIRGGRLSTHRVVVGARPEQFPFSTGPDTRP